MDTNAPALVELGWLWFDNDPRTSLEDKVGRASARFRQKFGRRPQLCYVNRATIPQHQAALGELQLRQASNVLPGHFLFVVEGEGSQVSGAGGS